MIELFRTENLLVRSLPAADTSRWVITFDNYGIGHGFDRAGFAQEFLESQAISAIHVMGVQEDWYQYPEMFAAMDTVREAVRGASRVMTYGSSMGGYAALRFADAAGANAVLAISPQYSIDPAKVPFETRWLQDARRIRWLPEIDGKLTCRARPIIVYDPVMCQDRQQAEMIRADVDITAIALPFVSHPATTYLAEVKLLKALALGTLAGDLDGLAFKRKARAERRNSGLYIANLAAAQPSHRPRLALSLAQLSVERAPHNPQTRVCLARLLSEQGQIETALAQMEQVVARTGSDPVYLIPYVDTLRSAGRHQEAEAHTLTIVEAWPQMAHLHAWRGAILCENGKVEAGLAALNQAISLDPENTDYPKLLKSFRSKAQRDREAGTLLGRTKAFLRPFWKSLMSRLKAAKMRVTNSR